VETVLAWEPCRDCPDDHCDTCNGDDVSCGDGGPASEACIHVPRSLAAGPDGGIYVGDCMSRPSNWALVGGTVRRLGPDGILSGIAGYREWSLSTGGFSGDGGPATAAELSQSLGALAVRTDGALYISDRSNHRIRVVEPVLPGLSSLGDVVVASQEGTELYVFTAAGRHLRTVDAWTGVTHREFGYDDAGWLVTVTDASGRALTITRALDGDPQSISSADGIVTTLALDQDGFLSALDYPGGDDLGFTYTDDGRLHTTTDARDHVTTFEYDDAGRLVEDLAPGAAAPQTLARVGHDLGWEVNHESAEGVATRYLTEPASDESEVTRSVSRDASGERRETRVSDDGDRVTTLEHGATVTQSFAPDPRWEMQTPVPASTVTATPGGITHERSVTRGATLDDPYDLLTVDVLTQTTVVNGRAYVLSYDRDARQAAATSPEGRVMEASLDTDGRLISVGLQGMTATRLEYDDQGRLSAVRAGTDDEERVHALAYTESSGRLWTITDAEEQVLRLERDAAGRVHSVVLPDDETIGLTYHAGGRLYQLTPPGRPAHAFTWSPRGLMETWTLPDAGQGADVLRLEHDDDRRLALMTRADGGALDPDYDEVGRLETLTTPETIVSATYVSGTRLPETLSSSADGVTIMYGWDGFLPTSISWQGAVTGSVTRAFDADLRLTTERVNGVDPVIHDYDDDGLLSQAGMAFITRHPQTGLPETITLYDAVTTFTYSDFGELRTQRTTVDGALVHEEVYVRDHLGRITTRDVTIDGTTSSSVYAHDARGRLTDVTVDGHLGAHYGYDANGNRTSVSDAWGLRLTDVDARDRMTRHGGVDLTYGPDGALHTRGEGTDVTTLTYDALGALRQVDLPDGRVVTYRLDARTSRVQRAVDGVPTRGFLYRDPLRPAAELDGAGAVRSRFVHGLRPNLPIYMVRDGHAYLLVADHVGSPRLVIDAQSGDVAQRLSYTSFGEVVVDTNPGFQPFGFAGGIYDPDTGLVRFGARDYDPELGRWTAPDPLGFAAGDPNLYAYVNSDPVNGIDPWGLETWGIGMSYSAGAGTGLSGSTLIVVDDNWNVGLASSVSTPFMGAYTPAASLSGTYQNTSADTIHDLEGPAAWIGASVGEGFSGGADFLCGGWGDDPYYGYNVNGGAGVTPPMLPAEWHAGWDETQVVTPADMWNSAVNTTLAVGEALANLDDFLMDSLYSLSGMGFLSALPGPN
jgi:RHS repeat-associated protein